MCLYFYTWMLSCMKNVLVHVLTCMFVCNCIRYCVYPKACCVRIHMCVVCSSRQGGMQMCIGTALLISPLLPLLRQCYADILLDYFFENKIIKTTFYHLFLKIFYTFFRFLFNTVPNIFVNISFISILC